MVGHVFPVLIFSKVRECVENFNEMSFLEEEKVFAQETCRIICYRQSNVCQKKNLGHVFHFIV